MKITDKIIENHGLNKEEYLKIKKLLKREPNLLELGVFSAMWNEHCSYKSSKAHLKKLYTKNKYVIQGPGENAGVIDIEDDDAIVFKIESHNHPSYIEPYQGAATGVGGILRDVFTMGARPIALLNSLHFGSPKHNKTKHLLNGVVSGISGYGNCMGIPTVGGETKFHKTYNENILVNAMAVGHVDKNKIFYSKAEGVNKSVVYVGSKTGRDGIHGASMASAEFDENSNEKKPTVQVGDPFTEKLLMEACLELMAGDSIISIQDMGAAGLTSSSVEMASKGKLGIEINLNKIPCRENKMTPYEMMLSESQERMLIILKDGMEAKAKKVFDKWDLEFVVIGKTTDTNDLVLKFDNKVVGEIPINALSENAPVYERKYSLKKTKRSKLKNLTPKNKTLQDSLIKILSSCNQSDKSWVTEQYDQMVMGNTIKRSGGDGAIIKIHNKEKSIAITVDSSANYCMSDPFNGGKQIVCETWRNLISTGAKPLALTNCLNFGNPENEEVMGQFVEILNGMNESCKFLDLPIVSGNVSFYNGTNKKNIFPTPVIGGVGLIKKTKGIIGHSFQENGSQILVIGKTFGHLTQSSFFMEVLNVFEGPAPEVNLANEKNNGLAILGLAKKNYLESVHDVSAGGIITSLVEMSIHSDIGVNIIKPKKLYNSFEYYFGEDQGRYIVEIKKQNIENVEKYLKENNIFYEKIGITQEKSFVIDKDINISVKELKKIKKKWYYNYNGITS